jgi:hypothetical protein
MGKLVYDRQYSFPSRWRNLYACASINTDAVNEFASTWTWFRGPSPPDVPDEECVSFAFISCLTYPQC